MLTSFHPSKQLLPFTRPNSEHFTVSKVFFFFFNALDNSYFWDREMQGGGRAQLLGHECWPHSVLTIPLGHKHCRLSGSEPSQG
jgi:hypothetical protein